MAGNISTSSIALQKHKNGFRLFMGMLLLLVGTAIAVNAQSGPAADTSAGCTLENHVYTCNKASFEKVLNAAQTASIDVSPRDRVARAQLGNLVTSLGKALQPGNASANLIFSLAPVDPNGGVTIGPAEREIGSLLVYAAGPDGMKGVLLWAETFKGHLDTPWPAVVHALISQFSARFATH
jgi:hypothetical protein